MSGRMHKIFSPINEKDGIVIYCGGEHEDEQGVIILVLERLSLRNVS